MEKSEITEMPEGMSSEALDKLTTEGDVEQTKDADLAQEALDATEESSPAGESAAPPTQSVRRAGDVAAEETEEEPELSETDQQLRAKDSKIAAMKHSNRDLELDNARLQGELEARKSLGVKTEEVKSPLEIAEAAYSEENEGSTDGFAVNGELYRLQKAFEDKQDADKTEASGYERSKTAMDRSVASLQTGELSVEKVGEGLDFHSVVGLGKNYLDKADLMKIEIVSQRDGVDAAVKKTYELCKQAILGANNTDTKLLQNALAVKGKPQTKPKKKEPTDIDALTTGGEDTSAVEQETHSKRLTDFIFAD